MSFRCGACGFDLGRPRWPKAAGDEQITRFRESIFRTAAVARVIEAPGASLRAFFGRVFRREALHGESAANRRPENWLWSPFVRQHQFGAESNVDGVGLNDPRSLKKLTHKPYLVALAVRSAPYQEQAPRKVRSDLGKRAQRHGVGAGLFRHAGECGCPRVAHALFGRFVVMRRYILQEKIGEFQIDGGIFIAEAEQSRARQRRIAFRRMRSFERLLHPEDG